MDSWGRPNPNDHRLFVSETDSRPSPPIQRQPSLRQQQSEAQIPLHVTTPPPPAVSTNEPALWQLGRHDQYKYSTGHDQQSSTFSGKPTFGYPEGDGFGPWDFERVQHQVDKFDDSKLVDVEGDLHRGLKARQVRFPLVMGACWSLYASHRFQ